MTFQELIQAVQEYNQHPNLKLIEEAYNFAKKAHEGQKRESGADFFEHCEETAKILAELKLNSVTIAAGLLHDILEDTKIRLKVLEEKFGQEVAYLVDGVSKIEHIDLDMTDEEKAQYIKKILLATIKDVRVILIKLADRLHNMRTLKYLEEKRQKQISKETLDIYAPIAHKLGINKIKSELEDLSLRFLNPNAYQELKTLINVKKEEREKQIEDTKNLIQKKLEEHNIKAIVTGRAKSFYSIYRKLQNRPFGTIYDLLAFRVITKDIEDCYKVLGVLHSTLRYMQSEFADYIANPKPNGYQSIHTKVIHDGKPIEIQIRTEDMHLEAEEGIAAHWRYKGTERDKKFDRKIAWLRQILEWGRNSENAKDFIETMKIDIFKDEIIVFTPKGDPIALPEGSTPIDFAYEIHSTVGDHCIRAKVNNNLVALDHKLKSGDIIEIHTSANAKPSRQWLNFTRTSHARAKIRVALGITGEHNVKQRTKEDQDLMTLVEVENIENPEIQFSKCCAPKLGERIHGFKTKDGKIAVHCDSCPNLDNLESIRLINVRWKHRQQKTMDYTLCISVKDRVGVLFDILNIIAMDKINVSSVNSKTKKDHIIVTVGIQLKEGQDISELLQRIKYISEVIDAVAME